MNNYTKVMTASGLAYTGATEVYSIVLAAGSDAATVIIYDWTDATGTRAIKLSAAAGTSAIYTPTDTLKIKSGIYVVLTGTSPALTVQFDGYMTTTSTSSSTTTSTTTTQT